LTSNISTDKVNLRNHWFFPWPGMLSLHFSRKYQLSASQFIVCRNRIAMGPAKWGEAGWRSCIVPAKTPEVLPERKSALHWGQAWRFANETSDATASGASGPRDLAVAKALNAFRGLSWRQRRRRNRKYDAALFRRMCAADGAH
jgi:hypothetical protein